MRKRAFALLDAALAGLFSSCASPAANPVVQRLALLNVVGFNQATQRYVYTVNENPWTQ